MRRARLPANVDIIIPTDMCSLIFVQSTIINFRYRDKNYATLTMSLGSRGADDGPLSPSDIWTHNLSWAPLSLSLSRRPLFAIPGRPRVSPPRLARSATISVPRAAEKRPGPAGVDSCEGTPGGGRHQTGDPGPEPDQWCNYSGRLQRWGQEKPVSKLEFWSSFWITVLLWTLSIIRREIIISWTSCLFGNDESLAWILLCRSNGARLSWGLGFEIQEWCLRN